MRFSCQECNPKGKYFDIAVRDIVPAIAAYSLARLTEMRPESVREVRATKADMAMQRR